MHTTLRNYQARTKDNADPRSVKAVTRALAKRATTNGNTNAKAKQNKLINYALPEAKPPKQNEQTTRRSHKKSAATTKNSLRRTHYTNLHNCQDQTTTKAAPTMTAKHRTSTQ